VKIAWAAALSIWIMLIDTGLWQVFIFAALLCLSAYGGTKISEAAGFIRLFVPIFILVFILHLFYHEGELLFHIWIFKASDIGLKAGLFNIARFVNFLMLAVTLFSCTSPIELAEKISTGFGIFRNRLFRELGLVSFIAMRFLPELTRERAIVKMAMIARGAKFGAGLTSKLKTEIRLLLPLFSRVIRQTDSVAAAIALKSYNGNYFSIKNKPLPLIDIVLLVLPFAITALIIVI
jgi:energy-coupling factor transporter transmembrane protein EcfT